MLIVLVLDQLPFENHGAQGAIRPCPQAPVIVT